MSADAPQPFIDVPRLLEASQPRARVGWMGPAVLGLVVLILLSAYLSRLSPQWKLAVDAFGGVMTLLIAGVMGFVMFNAVRRQRDERARLEAVEEMVQLRRWQEAAALLGVSLSRPSITPGGRVQFLFFLTSVLARYNRFDDAVAVQSHLLDNVDLDPATTHALRLGRAMAMLRQDHLFDADRAIADLRKDVRAVDESAAPASAGLALLEMYRDVKTGHPAEAIEMFNRALPTLREQLGHRVADAHALAAKAYDFLNEHNNAQSHWRDATTLSPAVELTRRYPELATLAEKYHAATAPTEQGSERGGAVVA